MKNIMLLLSFCCIATNGFSQIGINTTSPDAQLDIRSSNQAVPSNKDGILIPKIDAFPVTNPTAAQQGMMVYLTTLSAGKSPGFYYWDNTGTPQWRAFGGSTGWQLVGNSGTDPVTNFIGTTDDNNVVFKRNNVMSGLLNESEANTSFGVGAFNTSSIGVSNSAFGNNALASDVEGFASSAFGNNALMSNIDGQSNSAFGAFALMNNVGGQANTAIGSGALSANIGGGQNTAVGVAALSSNISGLENTAIGNSALQFNTIGRSNVALGTNALLYNSTAYNSVAIGADALQSESFTNGGSQYSADNVAVGKDALFTTNPTAATNGIKNTALGNYALSANQTGATNTALGFQAGNTITTGNNNIAIGANANVPSATVSDQMSIGNVIYGTTMSTTALGKIGIGEMAPSAKFQVSSATPATPANTDGVIIPRVSALTAPASMTAAQNGMMVFLTTPASQSGFYYWDNATTSWKGMGANTGWSLDGNDATNANFIGTTNATDLFFKRNSINSGTISEQNTAFGLNCLNPLNVGLYNVAFGVNALSANTSGLNNTAFGDGALQKNTSGGENSAYGSDALRDNLLGSDNIANGFFAMSDNKNASKNIAIGRYALRNQNTTNGGIPLDTNNIAIGIESMYNTNPTISITGINNTAVGNYAMKGNSIGLNNVAIGHSAMLGSVVPADNSGYNNSVMGAFALYSNTSGNNNIAIGTQSMFYNESGYENTGIGSNALIHSKTGYRGTAIGMSAMENINNTTIAFENKNVAIGYRAYYGSLIPANNTGNSNTAVGFQALSGNSAGGSNVAVGESTLIANTTGNNNTTVGFQAGNLNTTGSNNITIGANTNAISPIASNQMSIANVFYGEAMDNIATARFSIGDLPSVLSKFYSYSTQLTSNGDGQSSIFGYRMRDSRNDGTGYGKDATNRAVGGYNLWGDFYTFGVTGHCYNDFTRTGGVLGADVNGGYWSSLGYKNSGSITYGVYATAALATGAGRFSQPQKNFSIGGGFYGGIIGSWSKGNVIGQVSSGNMFASYNSGDEYTAGKQIELVDTGNQKTAAYTVTSTESIVYKKGKTTLINGNARVDFDQNYANLLGEIPVVTTTPMGQCNGLYIESIDQKGFVIKELNNGTSNVAVSWIAVGDRIDAQQNKLSKAILEKDFDNNINEVMFNENNKNETAKAMWFDGNNIQFGKLPEEFIEKTTGKKE